MKTYNKLVRDKIPEIIKKDNVTPVIRTLGDAEYLQELIKKLKEETAEFEADNILEELADIQEIVNALTIAIGKNLEELETVRKKKLKDRGGFKEKIFLERVEK